MTFFAGMSSDSGNKKKKIFFILFATILVVADVIGIVAGNGIANSGKNDNDSSASQSHVILKSACSNTPYPELCYSEIQKVPGAEESLFSFHFIQESLDQVVKAAKETITTINNIVTNPGNTSFEPLANEENVKSLTKREKTALHDCLEMVDVTLDQLHSTKDGLQKYSSEKKSHTQKAEDLKILLSAARTNQGSCIDGFSHEEADKNVGKLLLPGQVHVQHMVSNVLAMITNLTNTDMFNQRSTNFGSGSSERNLVEETTNNYKLDSSGFPTWLSAGDRRLLQAPSVTPNVVVAGDGSGNYTTVSAAVAAAPEGSSSRYIIRIKAGIYRENVAVTKKKTNIMFVGDGRRNTIITGSRNVVDGSTTLNSATVTAVGARFLARDITFENTAGPSKHQAVAFRSSSDFSAFYRCNFLAYQDTLYVHSLRQFYVKCLIAGTVDFIFGNAAVVLQDCDIHARRPNSGQRNILTAQGRDDPNQNTGIVIQKCRIGATSDLLPVQSSFPTYLGRPWKEYSRTIVMQSTISNVINPAGWFEWNGNFALNTLYYAEYQNTGAGAGTANRVKWRGYRVLTNVADVLPFTVGRFLQGSRWLGATGFPYSLGL